MGCKRKQLSVLFVCECVCTLKQKRSWSEREREREREEAQEATDEKHATFLVKSKFSGCIVLDCN
jgi:hypothetical protein